jgi:hypothetical protein
VCPSLNVVPAGTSLAVSSSRVWGLRRKENNMSAEGKPMAVWEGRITFGLVGIPIVLVPAVDAREHIGFHLLHRKV